VADNRQIDQQQFEYLPEGVADSDKTHLKITFEVNEMLMNPQGSLHGGVMAKAAACPLWKAACQAAMANLPLSPQPHGKCRTHRAQSGRAWLNDRGIKRWHGGMPK